MGRIVDEIKSRSWTKGDYLISTNASLIPLTRLCEVFSSDTFYWAKSLPEEVMRETLENSICFGLYKSESTDGEANALNPKEPEATQLLGFARCITDCTTFLYVTDVWVDPATQGKGLGKWLVGCIKEVIDTMPYLRRSILFTGDWERSVPFYEKLLDMTLVETKKGKTLALMERKGPGHPSFA
ncbi:hypothetical protein PFICI_09149 [Pestalotiopsis fici W106-1]|uniref:N-acetyltransferase domain-containing protein n=1 Tax=Pestalotiopsis fici (strain W106-1 / CGMCC3.15140) TaxID=1229662 RepID=W3X2B4_PESFW|nr:uncharacterized protein PFICI_09149 [Pestalotiopsis fici W106-1]ETS79296.1 hypothetical protein PFICI_09149 [Pestalotiopsis fici W106-1]